MAKSVEMSVYLDIKELIELKVTVKNGKVVSAKTDPDVTKILSKLCGKTVREAVKIINKEFGVNIT